MDRKKFIQESFKMGLGAIVLPHFLTACSKETFEPVNYSFDGKVLIVGAGTAGLFAGFILEQQGIDYEIIEASSVYGGRVKKTDDLASFPIDLGAEWMHTDPGIRQRLLGEGSSQTVSEEYIKYRPQSYHKVKENETKNRNYFKHFYSEYKFKHSTWFDYLEKYIVPSVSDKITYNKPIKEVDYSGASPKVVLEDNSEIVADKVILTVPTTQLKNGKIDFNPSLPSNKLTALDNIMIPGGLKVFLKFSETFYPDMIIEDWSDDNEKLLYNAAFGKERSDNILGVFTVGAYAESMALKTDQEIIENVISRLDALYEGKATQYFQEGVVQNWTAEPYIQGSYTFHSQSESSNIEALQAPLDNKVFFAGEAYNLSGWNATVNGAAQSAYECIEGMFG